MIENIQQEYFNSLLQAEEELRNGAIIGLIILNAYNPKFNFDFGLLEKTINQNNSYSHKVALLSLSNLIEDKKIRKKYNNLINKFLGDAYSSVRKAAAFSEPLLWAWEKEKNQAKKITNLTKNYSKLNVNYLEGVLLGLGTVSSQLDPEIYNDLFAFYETIQQNSTAEAISISNAFGLALFGSSTKNGEQAVKIILKLLESPVKKIRIASAEALSFLIPFVSFETSIAIISVL